MLHPGYLGKRVEHCNRHWRLLSSHLLPGVLSQRLLVRETDIARISPLRENQLMFRVERELCFIMKTVWAWLNLLSFSGIGFSTCNYLQAPP